MKNLFLLIICFFLSASVLSQNNLAITSPNQITEGSIVILEREKSFIYSALKARIKLNGSPIVRIGNGRSEEIIVPQGRNTLQVSGFASPGSSSITFFAKKGHTYTFKILPRKSTSWFGVFGGIGSAIAFGIEADGTEGGLFGIAIHDSTEFNAEINNSPRMEMQDNDASSTEDELRKLKKLFDQGLITKDVYEEKQKELLGI